jgi:uracil phosphoribosyltransferase
MTTHLQASWYLNKLPESFAADDRVLVSDPMMATGGTMVQVKHQGLHGCQVHCCSRYCLELP